MLAKQAYLRKIDAIPVASFNREQKEVAKKILESCAEFDLDKVYSLITQRVKTGFVFDAAPEVNHDCVCLAVENKELHIGNALGTEHKLIIGENYDVLKNLCATYIDRNGNGLIDVIYIDPPYNTEKSKEEGNNYKTDVAASKFVYRDKFTRDGWLNMMNERLKLARQLLKDTGVIFISIDDTEQAYLKVLCDEIFGEENFVATFPWRKRTAKSDVPFGVSQDYEWIECYAKSQEFKASIEGKGRKYYETPDFPNKPWRIHDMTTQRSAKERPNSDFTIINPKNGNEYPVNKNAVWRVTKETFKQFYNENRIVFPSDYDFLNISKPVLRYFKDDDAQKDGEDFGFIAVSTNLPAESGMSEDGTKGIKKIFGDIPFSFPKPVSLIKYLLKTATNEDSIILDFFGGCGTTGQAVMELNREDGGRRRFILCTNNENNIATGITWERLYRVINGEGSKGEEIKWEYKPEQKSLINNQIQVFEIKHHPLTLDDLATAEKLKAQAEIEFKKLNPDYKPNNDFDIYNELSALNPYKD